MILDKETATKIVYENHSEWEAVTDEEITGSSRWSRYCSRVFKNIPSGKFYMFEWSGGLTEMQEETAYQHVNTVEVIEVIEQIVTIKKWCTKPL